jgi:hypothetical protein
MLTPLVNANFNNVIVNTYQGTTPYLSNAQMGTYSNWSSSWTLPSSVNQITFSFTAQATNDIVIGFSPTMQTNNPMYEIVIGGWVNTQSVIRRQTLGTPVYTSSATITSPGNPNNYTIVINNQTGTLTVTGASTTMQYTDPSFLSNIGYFCFTSWNTPITYSNISVTANVGGAISFMNWSPDGRFIALNFSSGTTAVYSFNGVNLTLAAIVPVTGWMDWSPDGAYLAINNGTLLYIYKFNGVGLRLMTTQSVTSGCVAWHPTGQYIAASTGAGIGQETVYAFNGTSLTSVATYATTYSTGNNDVAAWSPDGNYLVLSTEFPGDSNQIHVLRFNGTGLTLITSQPYGPSGTALVHDIVWSPNGRYFALRGRYASAGGGFANTNELRTYEFDGRVLIARTSFALNNAVTIWPEGVLSWHPSGSALAVRDYNSSLNCYVLSILNMNYIPETNPQAFTNAIVFGNSALGSNANLNVKVLSDARVEINGKVLDDSV